jgi:hypothetical protein
MNGPKQRELADALSRCRTLTTRGRLALATYSRLAGGIRQP